MKKVISFILVLTLALSLFSNLSFQSAADDSQISGSCGNNVTYTYTNTNGIGVLTISGSGAMMNYSASTTPFPPICFREANYIVIKDGVTGIGNLAFKDNTNLTSVTIGNSVTSIGNYAFWNCTALSSITLPNSTKSIGSDAFCGCSGLTGITIPNSVTSIGNSAFWDCSSLTGISISDSVTSIGDMAFSGCTSLRSITIPDKVTNIGYELFKDCKRLTSVTIGNGVTSIDSYAFQNCIGLTNITIPDNVTNLGRKAFYGCTGLTSVMIGDGITSISSETFKDCTSLTSITIPNSVTSIGDHAFTGCKSLRDLTLPNSVKSIEKCAFTDCIKLNSIAIPNSVTSIDVGLFSGCKGLTSITIPDSVTSIGVAAFKYCRGLRNVTIPDSVSSIGDSAFFGCTGLTELTMPCSAKIYNSSLTFSDCTYIEKLTFTKGTGTMQDYGTDSSESATNTCYRYTPWFISRSKLKEVVIDDGIINIGKYVFSDCTNLTSVTIGNSVTSIGNYAFQNCTGLTKVNISNVENWCRISFSSAVSNPLYYAQHLYLDDSEVNDLIIPDTIKSIGSYTFYNCTGLKSVTIGNGVTNIDSYAFKGSTNISKTYLYSKVINSTQNLVASMPASSTLYAYASTDAQIYCNIYGISLVVLEEPRCDEGIHTYTETIVKSATCEEAGKKLFKCRYCGVNYEETIPALGHVYVDEVVYPTCIQQGYNKHTCTRCGDIYTDAETDLISHTAVVDEAVAPTCQQTGLTAGSHCSVCGAVLEQQQILPITNHQYSEEIIEANCAQQGFTIHACIYCGDCFKSDFTATTDKHDYKATITTPAACSQQGVKTFTCSICGDKYTENIAMTEHTPAVDKAVAPTCTKAGLTEGSHCSVCGYVITEQALVPANNHSFNAAITKEASCSQAGVKTYTCSACGDKYTEAIPMIEHTVVIDEAVAPTCAKVGLTDGTHCSVCGKILSAQTTIAAKGHNYTSAVTTESSCSQAGVKTFTCTDCGDSYKQSIALKEHTIVIDKAVAPTCMKYGLTEGKSCSGCGKVFELQEKVEPLGHDFGTEITPATLTKNGIISHPCSRCDKAADSEVIALPKTFALAKTSYVYSGKAITPAVTVKDVNGKVLKKGTDYSASYSANKAVGIAKVVITFIGNYSGTKTLTFTILPKGTNLALAAAKKAFTAKWTKIAGVTGYQVQYSTNAKFTGAKTLTIKGARKYTTAIKNLKAGGKYYVRIRTYQTVGGKNYFSAWSKAVKVKTK